MKIRLSIVVFIAAIVLSLSFTACMGDAPDGMSAETAETTSGSEDQKMLEIDLEQCGEFLPFTELGFNGVDLVSSCGRQGVLEAGTKTADGLYYAYNMDTGEIDFMGQSDTGIVSSGVAVFMEDGSYATTDLFRGEDDKLYRTVLAADTNGFRILESKEIQPDEFPFIYLHKMSETQFLATEIDPAESMVKRFDLESNTITTLLSFPYNMENGSKKTGKVLRNALVSGNSIYALLLTLDSQECYEIEQYDLDGNYIATLDSSAAKRFFTVTPYNFNCIGNHIILHDVNANCGIYRIDGNNLTEIISPKQGLQVYLSSIADFYGEEEMRYIFLSNHRENQDNLLFALDLCSSELKKAKIKSPDKYLHAFSLDPEGNLILEMKKEPYQIQAEYYYLSAETINRIFSEISY
ncbi:hypothetical protein D7X33_01465 [Butyricicoccus sp. 1XD8-22]|nr:hypothetical protein D7X33_01465 [Butyricicoccus sp. 1XD8-22]